LLSFVDAYIHAELTHPGLAILFGDVTRQKHQVPGTDERRISAGGGCGWGKRDVQLS
jgi:hypothetical protein